MLAPAVQGESSPHVTLPRGIRDLMVNDEAYVGDRNVLDWPYRDVQSAYPHELLSPIREATISDLQDLKTSANRWAGRLFTAPTD
jgi:hypothetical protein